MTDAQLLTSLFPDGVPGYGTEQGVTVQSRARPAFDPLGIRIGTVMIRPLLERVHRLRQQHIRRPNPSRRVGDRDAAVGPDGHRRVGRQRRALFVSADDVRYLGEPSQNRTDGAAFLGSTFNIGRDKLTLGFGYLTQHEDRTALDALPSDRPVAFTVANLRASYDATFGRFTATPAIDLNRWRFDNTTILGVPISEAARDRTTAQAALTLRYGWMSGRDLLLVSRVLDTHYDHPAAGVPSNNSTRGKRWPASITMTTRSGVTGFWEVWNIARRPRRRSRPQTTGIAEAEVTWSPSGLTTVRAAAARGIEDAAQTGLSSYTYTAARLTVDHEYLRNVLLNASATVRHASFYQTGGQQLGMAFGVGTTWLINRNFRLSLTYDFTDVRNAHLPAGTVAGDYTRGLTLLTLRVGL